MTLSTSQALALADEVFDSSPPATDREYRLAALVRAYVPVIEAAIAYRKRRDSECIEDDGALEELYALDTALDTLEARSKEHG